MNRSQVDKIKLINLYMTAFLYSRKVLASIILKCYYCAIHGAVTIENYKLRMRKQKTIFQTFCKTNRQVSNLAKITICTISNLKFKPI